MKNIIIPAWICFVYLILYCTATDNYTAGEACQCNVDLNELIELNKHPMLLNPRTKGIIYPTYEDSVYTIGTGETIETHCTKTGIMIGDEHFLSRKLIITCMYQMQFTTMNVEFNIHDIRCVEPLTSLTRLTKNNCGKQGQEIDVGFDLVDGTFLTQYTVCFNFHAQVAEFTRSVMYPVVTLHSHVKNIKKCNDEYFNLPRPVYVYYDSAASGHLFTKQTGRPDYTKWVITKSRRVIVERYFLVPQTDFFYKYEKRSTQYYINIIPHFATIPWNSLRMFLKWYSVQNKVRLNIYSGTFLRMKLLHVESKQMVPIYLDYHLRKMPIPEIIWIVAYDKQNSAGVAIIGVNNFMTKNSYSRLCPDVSNRIPWLSEYLRKYVYACRIRDWFKVVNYAFPNFQCRYVLGSQMPTSFENFIPMELDNITNSEFFSAYKNILETDSEVELPSARHDNFTYSDDGDDYGEIVI